MLDQNIKAAVGLGLVPENSTLCNPPTPQHKPRNSFSSSRERASQASPVLPFWEGRHTAFYSLCTFKEECQPCQYSHFHFICLPHSWLLLAAKQVQQLVNRSEE